ncbi:MAG: trigger factor [Anaerolineae bacterium]|nr:MAG: trigger factor [Anaerolineae bacterium]
MKIDTETLEDRQIQLTIEVPDDRYNAAMRSAARRMSKRDKIPGFRPGKVPFDVAVGRFGEDAIFDEALDTLGQDVYKQALEDSELEPFAPGALNEVISREPLVLRYLVPLAPEVDLGAYRKVRVKFKPPEVSDEALEAMMEDLRQRQALIEPAERPVQMSDVAVINIEGNLDEPEEEETALVLKESGISLLIEEDTDWPFPGIAKELVGIEVDETRTLTHTFGEEYPAEELRGRAATFEITCQEVKSRFVPEWSDDLAQAMGDYESLLDLRIKARESLTESAEREAEAEYADKVLEEIGEVSEVTYPPLLADQEVDDLLHDIVHRLEAQKLTLEDYFQAENKTEAEVRDELRPRAEERVRRALILGKVVEEEELEVGEEQISGRIQRLANSIQDPEGNVLKALNTPRSRRRIENDLLFEMAIDRLVSIAKGENPEKGNPELEQEESEEEVAILQTGRPEPEIEIPEEEGESPHEGSLESELLDIQESESESVEE